MQVKVNVEPVVVAPAERPSRSLRDYIGLTLRGVCMGASDIVPGVSGGTMAFILGIYEELIQSIRDIARPAVIQAAVRLRWRQLLQLVNWQFLVAVAAGILLAIVSLARGLEWLLQNQPVYLWSFFFGLVLASVFTVSKRIPRWSPSLVAALLTGAVGAYFLVGAVPVQTPNAWWFLVLSGAVAICAMILPGISGAFILVLLGKYEFVLAAVNQRDIFSLALVAVGAVVGLISFAQILGWLFKRYHDLTVAVLTGLMVGSLRKVWPWKVDIAWLTDEAGQFVLSHGERIVSQQQNILPALTVNGRLNAEVLIALAAGLLGLGAVLLLDRLANGGRTEATHT